MNSTQSKAPSVFSSILWSVLIPSIVLEKGSPYLGSLGALGVGILIPFVFGLYSWYLEKKFSWIALMGLLNVMSSGILAIQLKGGIWFSIKEAMFPALIGVFAMLSTWTARPFIGRLLLTPQVMNLEKVNHALTIQGRESAWLRHIKFSNILFSISFFISAFLNFYLAQKVFTQIDPALDESARQSLLNAQLAEMNRKSYLVIAIPSLLATIGVFWYLMSGLKSLTGLKSDEIYHQSK